MCVSLLSLLELIQNPKITSFCLSGLIFFNAVIRGWISRAGRQLDDLLSEGLWELAIVSQKEFWYLHVQYIPSLGDIQKPSGRSPGQLALSDPDWGGRLEQMTFEGSFQPQPSQCFYEHIIACLICPIQDWPSFWKGGYCLRRSRYWILLTNFSLSNVSMYIFLQTNSELTSLN